MRAQFVYEKFTAISDPVADIGVGLQNKRFSVIGLNLFGNKWGEYDNAKKYLEEFLNVSGKNIYLLAKTKKHYKDETNELINYINKVNKKAKFGERIISRIELDQVATSTWYIFTQIKTDLGIVVEAHNTTTYNDERTYWTSKKTFIKFLDKFPDIVSVNEKFIQTSDPLKDMGVGIEHLKPKLKMYRFRTAFPRISPYHERQVSNAFNLDLDDIYYLGYDPLDPSTWEYADKARQYFRDKLESFMKGAKEIYSDIAKRKDGWTIRIYKTKIGKVARIYQGSSSGIWYIGDASAALKLHNVI